MSDPNVKTGFDDTEPEAQYVLVFSLAIIVTIVATMLFVTAYYDAAHDKLVYERQQLPINEDLRNLRTREDNDLHSYGFVDQKAGQVRIPIERAMELVLTEAAEGKPKYPTTPYIVKKEDPVAVAGAVPGAKPGEAPTAAPAGGHAVAPAAPGHK